MRQHGRPVGVEMLAEAERRRGRQPGERLLEQRLAVEQRRPGEIEAFAIEQVEGEIAEAVAAAGFQIGLEIVETGKAVLVLDDDLAVDQRRAEAELAERGGDRAEAIGPVERLAGGEPHRAPVDARLHAVAVVLDLVNPFRPARRPLARRRQAGRHEGRQQLLARAVDFRNVGQRALARLGGGGARRVVGAHVARRRRAPHWCGR